MSIRLLSVLLVFVGCGGIASSLAGEPKEPERRFDRHGDPLPPGAIARLGTVRFRGVRGYQGFSPDGKWLIVAPEPAGSAIALWDTATGREVRCFAGAKSLVFSPDGKRLAVFDGHKSHIRDADSEKEQFTIAAAWGRFSSDGKLLVTSEESVYPSRLQVWDAQTGRPLRQWQTRDKVRHLEVAADGRTVAWTCQGDDSRVHVGDLTDSTVKRTLATGAQYFFNLAPDGKTLATAAREGGVRLWDVAGGKELRAWNGRLLSCPVFSNDGKQLAWMGLEEKGQTSRLWIVARDGDAPRAVGKPIRSLGWWPQFSPDGKRLAVVTTAAVLRQRDIASGEDTPAFAAHDDYVMDVALSGDGRQVISRTDTEVFVWQARTGELLRRAPFLRPGQFPFYLPMLADGQMLLGEKTDDPRQDAVPSLYDPRTGRTVRFEGRPDVAAPGGRYVALHGRGGGLHVLDVAARRWAYHVDAPADLFGVQLSADGGTLVWCRRTAASLEVHVHRRATQKTFILIELPADDAMQSHFRIQSSLSPDGRWLLGPFKEGRLRRWDVTTGKEAPPLPETLPILECIGWSPDGRWAIAEGLPDAQPRLHWGPREARIWDTVSGTRLRHLGVLGARAHFTPDGRTMITTREPGVIHLWEVATGQERLRLQGHLCGGIGALSLRADGRMLVSAGYDSQVFVWDLTGRMPEGEWRPNRITPEQRRAAWDALASSDAKAAYAALWQLVADPEESIVLLSEKLRPVPRPQPGQVTRCITNLDSEEFAVRERAEQQLEEFAETAAEELRQTLTRKPSLEVRRRIEALLEKLDGPAFGDRLRALRSLEVLEQIGTKEARDVLYKLAEGAPGARLTQEARAARERMDRKHGTLRE